MSMSFTELFLTVCFSVLSSASIIGLILKFWLEKKIIHSFESKVQLIERQRAAFSQLLDLHSEKVVGQHHTEDWLLRYAKASKEILLWCPDDILHQYALYAQIFIATEREPEKYEIHFAESILRFRKHIGYNNRGNKINSKQIALIFSIGSRRGL
jgi:predicted MPP superfamily phosphohydrolase